MMTNPTLSRQGSAAVQVRAARLVGHGSRLLFSKDQKSGRQIWLLSGILYFSATWIG